jgi:MFS family permease
LVLAFLAVGLDATVLSVALPTLARSLHASESDLQWFSSGYLLVLAAAMLPLGLLGDRFGRKKVLLASLGLFAVGSAACAASPSAGAFIAARLLLGLAGAGLVVMGFATLPVLFGEDERPRAVGIMAAATFVSLPLGPILGGWLLTHAWWGWVFLINVPVAIVGLIATFALVPPSRAKQRPGLDPIGVGLSIVGLVALIYGLIQAGEHGWGNAGAVTEMAGGVAVLVGFFRWERRLSNKPGGKPLLDLALFRSRSYTWGVILSSIAIAVLGAGLLVGTRTGVGSGALFIAAWMAAVGFGMGLALASSMSAALSKMSAERAGVGAAALQAINKLGGPLGTAILGSVLSATYLARLAVTGLPAAAATAARQSIFGAVAVAHQAHSSALLASARHAFIGGMDLALLVSGAIALLGIVLTVAFLPRTTPVTEVAQPAARQHADALIAT